MNERKPRIFLCHAKEDKEHVRDLYRQLKAAGYHPWLDEEDLLPGQDWDLEIRRAIRGSGFFLACLSKASIDKRGYVHKEIKMGLDELDQMPEGKIYLIPVRLEECKVPDRLESRHWVDLFAPDGFQKLKQALDFELSPHRAPFEPELIHIPAGEFRMGSDPSNDIFAGGDEQPQHTVYLPDYYIAKTPVTYARYAAFLMRDTFRPLLGPLPDGQPPPGKENHPMVNVSWYDAMNYCQWLASISGKPYRLPSEAEWEKAARGTDGRIYPWGNESPDKLRCNLETGADTTSVGRYSPQGDSPYGCVDMVGNVWEWTLSIDKGYPYDPEDGREDVEASGPRVARGGAYLDSIGSARCASRRSDLPDHRGHTGFRLCVAAQQE